MAYTLEEKYNYIIKECLKSDKKNPLELANELMKNPCINIHGPEHHLLDGASFLTALKNAGLDFDLEEALYKLSERTIKMPGAMCGYWGVCGSSASIGAALSVIHKTGPLSNDLYYKENMEYTSSVVAQQAKIGGPRCCKRNARVALLEACKFVKEKYNIDLSHDYKACEFYHLNKECIKDRCPFFK